MYSLPCEIFCYMLSPSTTLRVLNGFTPNRWIGIVNLVRAMIAFTKPLTRSLAEGTDQKDVLPVSGRNKVTGIHDSYLVATTFVVLS